MSGGSMANLTGLMLARDQKLKFEERARGVTYVSDQTHASVAKGLRILGFRNEQVRKVKSEGRKEDGVARYKRQPVPRPHRQACAKTCVRLRGWCS